MFERLKQFQKERSEARQTYFGTQDEEILNTNLHIFKIISVIAFLGISCFLLIARFTLKKWEMQSFYHIFLFLLFIQMFIAFYINKYRLKNKKTEKLILILFSNILFIFIICIDTISSPTEGQIFASSFLVMAPTVFIMKPSRMFCDQIYFIIVYLIMALFFKDPEIIMTDLHGIILGFVYGFISYVITLELRMKVNKEVIKFKTSSEIDELSGIFNRRAATNEISKYLLQRKPEEICALFIIDIDFFKEINDTYGHGKGDYVIHSVAQILAQSFRKEDVVSRFGGDEFMVFIHGINNEGVVRNKCKMINEKVKEILGDEHVVTCSIGVCFLVNGDITKEKLLSTADEALYYTKEFNKGHYTIYHYGEHYLTK